ncbi:MAG TPA: hypothetical protein VM012_01000 [Flavitalea sp.]|nr:hypothetical protein [Flavitalea sp.]
MNKYLWGCILVCGLFSCKDSKGPDVSGIRIDLPVYRFEQDFFSLDTNQLVPGIARLQQKYGNFTEDFFANIMGLPPLKDTSGPQLPAIRQFIRDYKPVKTDADRIFKDLDEAQRKTIRGLQYVKHYFPAYKVPQRLITFIGPMDAYFDGSLGGYGDVITMDGLAVGLQLHLGANHPLYKSNIGQSLYPSYISRRFAPEYIPVNCIRNIIDDLYPDNSASKSLVEQMVEKGKRMYLLDHLLPDLSDTLKTGYTASQLKGCYENEGYIWNFFLKNSMLYNAEPAVIKSYIGDAPNTPEFGAGAPGYIGLFTGWQIVKKFMEKNSDLTLMQLMQTDAKKLFDESKYRPR